MDAVHGNRTGGCGGRRHVLGYDDGHRWFSAGNSMGLWNVAVALVGASDTEQKGPAVTFASDG